MLGALAGRLTLFPCQLRDPLVSVWNSRNRLPALFIVKANFT